MKTKDIKPGVVYGYRRGKYGSVEPVVFLAKPGPDQLYGEPRFRKDREPVFEHWQQARKPRAGRSFGEASVGYPVVTGRSEGADSAELLKVTLEDFRSATKRYDEARDITFQLVINPSHIVGPYDEAVGEEERRREAERRQYDEERAHREARQQRAGTLMEALTAHGITAKPNRYNEPTALEIPFDDVETLLGLLGGERP